MGRALTGVVALLGCSELKEGHWTPDAGPDAGVDGGVAADAGAAVDGGACPRDAVRCDGACLDPREDEANCGRCGVRCGAGEECRGGRCR